MQIDVTFRHMTATDAIKKHAVDKISRIKKYFKEPAEAHVVLSVSKNLNLADINVNANGLLIRSEEGSSDMYNSIDRAVAKLESQLKKYHDKLGTYRANPGKGKRLKLNVLESQGNSEPSHAPIVVETKEFEARPMILEEAIMQMELLQNDFFVFLNAKTAQVSILYRKKDNKLGLIETHEG